MMGSSGFYCTLIAVLKWCQQWAIKDPSKQSSSRPKMDGSLTKTMSTRLRHKVTHETQRPVIYWLVNALLDTNIVISEKGLLLMLRCLDSFEPKMKQSN